MASGSADPASAAEPDPSPADCLTKLKTVLPLRPISRESRPDSLCQIADRLRRAIVRAAAPMYPASALHRSRLHSRRAVLDPGPGNLGHAFDVAYPRLDAPAVRRFVRADAFDDLQIRAIFCGEVSPCGARRLDRIDGIDQRRNVRAADAPRPRSARSHRPRSRFDPAAGRRATSPPRSDRPRTAAATNDGKAPLPACFFRNREPCQNNELLRHRHRTLISCGRSRRITGPRFLLAPAP